MFHSGYLTLGRWRGATIRLHWSIPLGAMVFGGWRFDPIFLLGFCGLVLLHEVGHALVAWRLGHSVSVIEVTGLGGICAWSGNATPFERAAIAWGGVLAQACLLIATTIALWLLGSPASRAGVDLMHLATGTNLWLIAVNLIPVPPLDGAQAWRIFTTFRQRHGRQVPHGSWRDATPMTQRNWLDGAKRAAERRGAPSRRSHLSVVRRPPSDPENLEEALSPEARRAIEEALRRIRVESDDE